MLSKLRELYKSATTNVAYDDVLSCVEKTKNIEGDMLQLGFRSLYLVEALRESDDTKRSLTIVNYEQTPWKRAQDYLTLGYHLSDYHTDVHYISRPLDFYFSVLEEACAYDSLSVVFLNNEDPTVDNRKHNFRSYGLMVRPGGLFVFNNIDEYEHSEVHTLVLNKGFAAVNTNSKTVAAYVRVDREDYTSSSEWEESSEEDDE